MVQRRPSLTIAAIGLGQIFSWGTSFYLIAVLAGPVAHEMGWPMALIVGGQSGALLLAGLASPMVGRAIERFGGKYVLAAGSALLASGHVLLALSHHVALWYAAWALLGLAMACGLYDAAFSTLGQIFGAHARRPITHVTLFGGLASTICWPLSALLIQSFGWRGACLAYAAWHCAIMLPMHLISVPAPERLREEHSRETKPESQGVSLLPVLLGAILTVAAAVAATISVHLIALLEARGLALATAVAMGAIFGPAQVCARIVELALGRHYHAVWTLFASVLLVLAGVTLLGVDGSVAVIAASLLLYGAGNGLNSIARGAVPLALFGPQGYARLMGRLALPALIAQALAPPLVALVIERSGASSALTILAALAAANAAAVCILVAVVRRL